MRPYLPVLLIHLYKHKKMIYLYNSPNKSWIVLKNIVCDLYGLLIEADILIQITHSDFYAIYVAHIHYGPEGRPYSNQCVLPSVRPSIRSSPIISADR